LQTGEPGVRFRFRAAPGASTKESSVDDEYGYATPAEALERGVECAGCGVPFADMAYYDGDAGYFCERCDRERGERLTAEARIYAERECRITRPLPEYDRRREHSHTPDAYLAHCRHSCTNYDELIVGLDRESVRNRIYYDAIRDRITELIEQARPDTA
jgi:hypothetical protein